MMRACLPPASEPAGTRALPGAFLVAVPSSTIRATPIANSRRRRRNEDGALSLADCSRDGIEGCRSASEGWRGQLRRHWQRTLKILAIVGEALAQGRRRGPIRLPIERRNPAIVPGARWRDQRRYNGDCPVEGSQPATREMLASIALLQQGRGRAAGQRRDNGRTRAGASRQSHPQFGICARFCRDSGCERGDVADWPARAAARARSYVISELNAARGKKRAWGRGRRSRYGRVTRRRSIRDPVIDSAGHSTGAARNRQKTKDGPPPLDHATIERSPRRVARELRRWNLDIDDSGRRAACRQPQAPRFAR